MLHQDNKCVTAKAVSSEKWHIFSTLNYLLISARSQYEAAERREERRRTLSASTKLNVWDAWEMKQHLSPSFVFHFLICTQLERKFVSKIWTRALISVWVWMIANLQWISSEFLWTKNSRKVESFEGVKSRVSSHAATRVSCYKLVNDTSFVVNLEIKLAI